MDCPQMPYPTVLKSVLRRYFVNVLLTCPTLTIHVQYSRTRWQFFLTGLGSLPLLIMDLASIGCERLFTLLNIETLSSQKKQKGQSPSC